MIERIDPKRMGEVTVKATIGFIRWVFVILIIYIVIATILGYLNSGGEFLRNVFTLSVGGFFGFFFGYFGWRMAQTIEEHFMPDNLK